MLMWPYAPIFAIGMGSVEKTVDIIFMWNFMRFNFGKKYFRYKLIFTRDTSKKLFLDCVFRTMGGDAHTWGGGNLGVHKEKVLNNHTKFQLCCN